MIQIKRWGSQTFKQNKFKKKSHTKAQMVWASLHNETAKINQQMKINVI